MKILIFILPLLFLSGCDIFQTRDAELPDQSRSNYTPPSEPQILIQNLINSFSDKNAINYLKSFSDPDFSEKIFSFIPSAEASARFQIWDDWSRDDEFQYFNNLINSVPEELPVSLSIFNEEISTLEGGFNYSAEYSISVPRLNTEPIIYKGTLNFNIIRYDAGTLAIHVWEDIAIPGFQSWSELKGEKHL